MKPCEGGSAANLTLYPITQKGDKTKMAFQMGSSLLDACVLSVLAREDTYGYRLTQEVRSVVEVSESTLYPVLRRLQKDDAVEPYDVPYQRRNRRYYRLTGRGEQLARDYQSEWVDFKSRIDRILLQQALPASKEPAENGKDGFQHEQA